MATPNQTGPIAVYGATGYTGRLVCAELARRGAGFVAAGRNPAKLEALSGSLGGVPTRAVATDDGAGLRSLLDPCAAVIACAGPFCAHGEPIVAAAADTGTHYVDTTGEQPFMRLVFDRYGIPAERTGAALVSAMGFDYAPGDMIAALTAEGMGPLEEITLAYSVQSFRMTRGTTLSGMEMVSAGDLEYADGRLRPADRSVGRGSFRFPRPVGLEPMVRYPSGEPITVPRHVETRRVRTMLTAATLAPRRAAPLMPALMPAIAAAMRTPLKRLAEGLVNRLPEGPDPEARRSAHWMIVCEARADGATRRGVVSGTDVYGLTAATTVEGALRLATEGYERSGALAPSQAFDPAGFLDALADFGVALEVDPSAGQPAAA